MLNMNLFRRIHRGIRRLLRAVLKACLDARVYAYTHIYKKKPFTAYYDFNIRKGKITFNCVRRTFLSDGEKEVLYKTQESTPHINAEYKPKYDEKLDIEKAKFFISFEKFIPDNLTVACSLYMFPYKERIFLFLPLSKKERNFIYGFYGKRLNKLVCLKRRDRKK
jgi:hypothetical protein